MKKTLLSSLDSKILVVAFFYYLSAELGFLLAFNDRAQLPFWPPAGIALAMVLIYGRSVWPGIAIGSLIITVKNFWFGSIDSVQLIIAVAAAITAGRILEPILGEIILKRLLKNEYPFSKTMDAFQFVFVALMISIVSSGITAVTLWGANVVENELLPSTLFFLWVRNTIGILLFTPLVLSFRHFQLSKMTLIKWGELAIFILCTFLVFIVFNTSALINVFPYAVPFVVIPFLLWLAFRFEGTIPIAGYISVSLVAIYFTSQSIGPFFLDGFEWDSIILMQIYVAVVSISTLVLSSTVQERERAQEDLKKFNENLEAIVNDRTRKLKEEIQNRKDAQLKLEHTNSELIKKNTELDNFVYSVSHDLRAPISSILGLINIAKKDKSQHVKELYLEMIEKSARQQDHFIREILDQSRNSRLEVRREPVLFENLIEEAFEQLNYSNLNGNKFEKVVHVEQSQPFYTDKWRLKVILNNIISNSIRYKNGKDPVIKVDAKIDNHKVNLSIEDNGRGIAKEHIHNLGKMFYRATDEGAGSGLGLYIVKETLGKLNGSININSEEGHGTMVSMEIPEVELAYQA